MAKYNERLVNRITALIEADMYTITEICEAVKISRDTFYQWKEKNPDFSKRIEQAMEVRDERLVQIARISLKKKLEGYMYTEERCQYEASVSNPSVMVLKKKETKARHKSPDLRAIKYILEKEEKRKEKLAETKHQMRPHLMFLPDAHTAELLLDFEEKQRGTRGEMFHYATKEDYEKYGGEEL